MIRTSIVAYPQQANLSRRPRLLCGPLNHIKETLARPSRHSIQQAGRLSQAPLIRTDNRIAMSRPEYWVWRLPRTVFALVFRIDFAERSLVESGLMSVWHILRHTLTKLTLRMVCPSRMDHMSLALGIARCRFSMGGKHYIAPASPNSGEESRRSFQRRGHAPCPHGLLAGP
jgi:hypothetical protein